GADRQASERSEAAGEEARSAQEAAAIEIATYLGRERCTRRPAANVALCPLDQHDRSLSLRWIVVDAIEGLHLGRVGLIASLAFVGELCDVPRSATACGGHGGANRHCAEQIAAWDCGSEAIFHGTVSTYMIGHERPPERIARLGKQCKVQ